MRKMRRFLRMVAPLLLMLAVSVAVPTAARADLIDDFAWVLDQVPGVFPVSGQDIRDSRALIEDLKNVKSDTDALKVLEKHKNTSLGQKAVSSVGGVPSWFWDLIDTYIAFRTGDFWGVVGNLGEAAICILAQVMAGGALDVCGLIEELVKIGQALLDAATAVAEFFASIGEGAWEAAKAVGCSLGLGGCGKSSPPEQRAYAWVFAPEVPAGLTARKSLDSSAFPTLVHKLEADASAQPAKLHVPLPGWVKEYYPAGVVSTASAVFKKVVDAQWTADIAKNVLPQLAAKRTGYDNPGQVAALAAKAADAFTNQPGIQPGIVVKNSCTEDFSKGFGFAHVDRWIAMFPEEAKKLGGVKTNSQWCASDFWGKNQGNFGERFRAYAKVHYCPEFGQTLLCQTVEKYKSCTGLLGSAGLEKQCGVNVAVMGKEAAEAIYSKMKAKGSKIPCTIVPSQQFIGNKPADLICPRPTQGHACNEIYLNMFSGFPAKLVNCVVKEEPNYTVLRNKVQLAVTSLNQQYGKGFVIDSVDPLVVRAPSVEALGKVMDQNPDFGFQPPGDRPGFESFALHLPQTIDGVDRPTLGMDVKLPKATQQVQLSKIQEKVALVKPGDPDPAGQSLKANLKESAKTVQVVSPQSSAAVVSSGASAPMKTMSGSAPGGAVPKSSLGGAAQLSAAPGAIGASKGPDLGGVPAPAPAQGKLPASGGRAASPGTTARATGSAELRSGPRVTVAGRFPAAWGQGVTVPDSAARRSSNGVCDVAVSHDTQNAGNAPSGPFSRRWVNDRNPAPFTDGYAPLPAGGSVQKTDTLALKPGMNRLTLTLDPQNQVQETDETNNVYRLTITVTGTCGAPAAPAPSRGGGAPPPAGTRLPAVQGPPSQKSPAGR